MMRKALAAAFVIAAAIASLATADSPRHEEREYWLAGPVWCNPQTGESSGGGACFRLTGTETSVTVSIIDDTGLPQFALWHFSRVLAAPIAAGVFCQSTANPIPVPPDANWFEVDLQLLDEDCGIGIPTHGVLVVDFS